MDNPVLQDTDRVVLEGCSIEGLPDGTDEKIRKGKITGSFLSSVRASSCNPTDISPASSITSATVHSTHATDVIGLTQDGANSPHVPRYLPLLIPSLDDENLEDSAEDCRRLPKTAEELVEGPAEEPEVEEEDTQDASDKDFFKYTYFTDACNGWCEKL
ncbi:hypothetical protein PG988_006569 [Apiospora saccharicola]